MIALDQRDIEASAERLRVSLVDALTAVAAAADDDVPSTSSVAPLVPLTGRLATFKGGGGRVAFLEVREQEEAGAPLAALAEACRRAVEKEGGEATPPPGPASAPPWIPHLTVWRSTVRTGVLEVEGGGGDLDAPSLLSSRFGPRGGPRWQPHPSPLAGVDGWTPLGTLDFASPTALEAAVRAGPWTWDGAHPPLGRRVRVSVGAEDPADPAASPGSWGLACPPSLPAPVGPAVAARVTGGIRLCVIGTDDGTAESGGYRCLWEVPVPPAGGGRPGGTSPAGPVAEATKEPTTNAPPPPAGVAFEVGFTPPARPPPAVCSGDSGHPPARPWRRAASAVRAERARARAALGDGRGEGGVDAAATRLALVAAEVIRGAGRDGEGDGGGHGEGPREGDDAPALGPASPSPMAAADRLRRAATNARPASEVAAARTALVAAMESAGLSDSLRAALRSGVPTGGSCGDGATARRLGASVMDAVLPRLWVGGWAALLDDCRALKQRGITHVVSVVSAQRRTMPSWIRGHHHVECRDAEDASDTLAEALPGVVTFVARALRSSPDARVYLHCGAGISRGPSACVAYLIWLLGAGTRSRAGGGGEESCVAMAAARTTDRPAAAALALVKRARPGARPNPGFVRALVEWEGRVARGEPLGLERD